MAASVVPPSTSRPTRRRLRLTAVVALVVLAAAIAGSLWLARDPEPRMLERRSGLAGVTEGPVGREGDHELRDVRLRAESGSVGSWRTVFYPSEIAEIDAEAGDLLRRLGYTD